LKRLEELQDLHKATFKMREEKELSRSLELQRIKHEVL
jgi:hypothetical protein